MNAKKFILTELTEAQLTLSNFLNEPDCLEAIEQAATLMINSIKAGGKIISCGNGGSHCDAMHFAEELTGKYRNPRPALPAIAISDPTHMSCVSNDYGYEHVFSRFVEGLGQPQDILLGISTSGNSVNIVNAAKAAHNKKIKVICLTGNDGGLLRDIADVEVRVPHFGYADRIQEIHIKVIHLLIGLIESGV